MIFFLLNEVSHALCTSSDAFQAGRKASELVERAWEVFRETKEEKGVKDIVVSEDEGVRVAVIMDRLAKPPAVFKRGGSATPVNSLKPSDRAALVMMMKRGEAQKRGLD